MSGTGSSGDVHPGAAVPPSELGVLHVEAVFHDVAAEQADTIAAEMIARAHEMANLPEHGCDVDVNVRRRPSDAAGARGV